MPALFSNRKLADSFLNRNVIVLSEGHCNRNGHVRFGIEFDFGKHGKLANRVDIPRAYDMVVFNQNLSAYQDDIYELIGVFEELERWSQHGDVTKPFSHVLMQDKPLFFYAAVSKEVLTLQVFGEGLYDFEIRWDLNRAGESSSFSRKLNEMRLALVEHLRSIETVNMQDIINASQEVAA